MTPADSMSNKEALARAYAALAPFSNSQRWEFENNLVHLNFLTSHVPRGASVLDAGSYIGILALALKLLGYNVEGADKYLFKSGDDNAYSVADLESLRSLWKNHGLAVLEKDIMIDSFEKKYDAVVSVAVIEHQAYPRLFVEGLMHTLKPGGLIYVATPNVTNLINRARVLVGKAPLGNINEFYASAGTFKGHWREYTLRELKAMFSASGIEVLEAKNCQSMPPRWSKMRKLPQNVLKLFEYVIPGTGDTNLILGKKK